MSHVEICLAPLNPLTQRRRSGHWLAQGGAQCGGWIGYAPHEDWLHDARDTRVDLEVQPRVAV